VYVNDVEVRLAMGKRSEVCGVWCVFLETFPKK